MILRDTMSAAPARATNDVIANAPMAPSERDPLESNSAPARLLLFACGAVALGMGTDGAGAVFVVLATAGATGAAGATRCSTGAAGAGVLLTSGAANGLENTGLIGLLKKTLPPPLLLLEDDCEGGDAGTDVSTTFTVLVTGTAMFPLESIALYVMV